jgi:hypothetical protein
MFRRVPSLSLLVLGLVALTTLTAAAAAARDDPTTGATATAAKDVPVLEPGNEGADDASGGGEKVRRIKFGETVKLDDIGPIIVNEDCSMRRIANWEALTQREKDGAQRRGCTS